MSDSSEIDAPAQKEFHGITGVAGTERTGRSWLGLAGAPAPAEHRDVREGQSGGRPGRQASRRAAGSRGGTPASGAGTSRSAAGWPPPPPWLPHPSVPLDTPGHSIYGSGIKIVLISTPNWQVRHDGDDGAGT